MAIFGIEHPFVLAPMCDFLKHAEFCASVGAPDILHMEYTRVHGATDWHERWVGFINKYGPDHKVLAQLLGNDIPNMVLAAKHLQTLPCAGIDLNLGCPAPKIYKGNVGGGLLRDIALTERLIGELRNAVAAPHTFSVKIRLGFNQTDAWEPIFKILEKNKVDFVTVHLRTVSDGYHQPARLHLAKEVVLAAPCPVILNGDIQTVGQARAMMAETGAWGVSIGRGALRYPWIFRKAKEPNYVPTYADAWEYYKWVLTATGRAGAAKGFLNFLGLSVEPTGKFLKRMRGTEKFEDLYAVGEEWIASRGTEPFPEEPFGKLYARPSMEKPTGKLPRSWQEYPKQKKQDFCSGEAPPCGENACG